VPKYKHKRQELVSKARIQGIKFEIDEDLREFDTLSRFMSNERAIQLIEHMNCPDCSQQLDFLGLKTIGYITFRPNFCILYFCSGCQYWWEYDVDTNFWDGKKPSAPIKHIERKEVQP
jgi:hypothetical protein